MWPIKEKENGQIVAKSIHYCRLWECVVTVLLLTSTPLVLSLLQTQEIAGVAFAIYKFLNK